MSIPMIAIRNMKYRTRMLTAGEEFRVKNDREAKVLTHLKRAERANNENQKVALDDARAKVGMPPISKDGEDIKALRDEYEAKIGRRPFNGWSAETLRGKIAAA